MNGASFIGADLSDARLWNTDMRPLPTQTNLTNAVLAGADLKSANLSQVNITGADLQNASLRDAELFALFGTEVDFRSADLTRANLTDALLTSPNMTDATLRDVNLTNARIDGHLGTSKFVRADLTGANLSYATIVDADMTEARLTSVTIDSTGLPFCILRNADLTNWQRIGPLDLLGSDLLGATLDAVLASPPQVIFGNTVCPDGTVVISFGSCSPLNHLRTQHVSKTPP